MKTPSAAGAKFSDRIRFNWGFHDGAADVREARRPLWHGKPHFDPAYAAGYRAGQEAQAKQATAPESSEPAWIASGRRDVQE